MKVAHYAMTRDEWNAYLRTHYANNKQHYFRNTPEGKIHRKLIRNGFRNGTARQLAARIAREISNVRQFDIHIL